jgi:GNAT superfamily N-acetyltransferase
VKLKIPSCTCYVIAFFTFITLFSAQAKQPGLLLTQQKPICTKIAPAEQFLPKAEYLDERYYLSVQDSQTQLELRDEILMGIFMPQAQLLPTKIATSLWLIPSTGAHSEFLHQVFVQNRKPLWLAAGLRVGWIDELLVQQSKLQQHSFEQDAADQYSFIIAAKGIWVGRLVVRANDDGIHIVDIALLPDHQNQGIGQEVINYLKKQAQARNQPLTLNADETSRAYEWYLDRGFTTTQAAGINRSMAWNLESSSSLALGQ